MLTGARYMGLVGNLTISSAVKGFFENRFNVDEIAAIARPIVCFFGRSVG